MRSLLPALALSLLPTAALAQRAGEPIGDVALKELSQTDAKSFSDFAGRAVLIEFWAEWCGPCVRSIPHLNELQEKYGDQGLTILGMTDEHNDRAKTLAAVQSHGLQYAWAFDPGGELEKRYHVTAIPHALLVDPTGTVVWTGHPMALSDEMIEEALVGALELPLWKWPASAGAAREALQSGDLAKAVGEAEKLGPDGAPVLKALQGMVTGRVEAIQKSADEGNWLRVKQLLDRYGPSIAGLPEGAALQKTTARLQEPDAQAILSGQEKVQDLVRRIAHASSNDEASGLLGDLRALRDQNQGTIVGSQAGQWVERFEARLSKSKDR